MKSTKTVEIEFELMDAENKVLVFAVRRKVRSDGVDEVRVEGDRQYPCLTFTVEQAGQLQEALGKVLDWGAGKA